MNQEPIEMQQFVNHSWQRIENWLRDNAPLLLESLNPPVSEEEISRVEATINKQFPPSVRFSYLRHNGNGDTYYWADSGQGIFNFYDFMPLGKVLKWDEEMKRLEREEGLDDYDTANQIQILQFQCDFYCVESSLSGKETAMNEWRSRNDNYKHKPMAEDFAAYLARFADRLEDGEFYYIDDEEDDDYGRLLRKDNPNIILDLGGMV